jgi:hypothetical protein
VKMVGHQHPAKQVGIFRPCAERKRATHCASQVEIFEPAPSSKRYKCYQVNPAGLGIPTFPQSAMPSGSGLHSLMLTVWAWTRYRRHSSQHVGFDLHQVPGRAQARSYKA